MMTVLSANGRGRTTASDSTTSNSSQQGSTTAVVDHRLRDALRLLRCLDRVEISGTSLNWDARKCFVLLVSVRDTDARRRQAYAQGGTRSTATPFQLERTPAELKTLFKAMRHACAKRHTATASDEPCVFCHPITSGALVAEALRMAQDDNDIYETLGEAYDARDVHVASCCFGFLQHPLGNPTLQPERDGEWEAWLNGALAHVRSSVDIKASAPDVCEGARHVPALLARFLLNGFLPHTIP